MFAFHTFSDMQVPVLFDRLHVQENAKKGTCISCTYVIFCYENTLKTSRDAFSVKFNCTAQLGSLKCTGVTHTLYSSLTLRPSPTPLNEMVAQ